MSTRRSLLRGAALVVCAPMVNRGRFRLFGQAAYSARTLELVQRATVIDMLGLLTLDYRKFISWGAQPARFSDADYLRLKASGINVFHPAVGFVGGDIYSESLRDIQGWNALISAHGERFQRIDQVADLKQVKTNGKLGILIGQQNSSHFRTLDDVDRFYQLGQRVSQLTYHANRLGGGSSDPRDGGLTLYGYEIVDRMNRLGMAIDVSHCGDRTTMDAIHASRQPVLVTHSNCRALVPGSARCKTNEAIRELASKGGVMGLTMVRAFVRPGGRTTIEHVLDHIDYLAKFVGVEHVGIGSDVDLDGRDAPARPARRFDLDGIDYAKKIFDLTEGLFARGYTAAQIELILGGNFERVLAASWTPS